MDEPNIKKYYHSFYLDWSASGETIKLECGKNVQLSILQYIFYYFYI